MYEIDSLFDNTAFVFVFILQLILLIVFLRMAWNISKIRKHIVRENPEELFKQADKLGFIGREAEAIETYKEYIYVIKRSDMDHVVKNKAIEKAANCINDLGGEYSNTKRKM